MSMKSGNVVPLLEPTDQLTVQNAKVVSVLDKIVVINISSITHKASIAFSCMIQPEKDDIVLCTKNSTGIYYILGIIERPEPRDVTLSFPGNTAIKADKGVLSVVAQESINLATPGNLNCISNQAVHKSNEAVIDFNEIIAKGSNLQASFKNIRLISQMFNNITKQLIEKVKNYIRHTEAYDQIKAGQMTRKVEGLYAMDSKHTVMVSKKDTKIDGERIHMG